MPKFELKTSSGCNVRTKLVRRVPITDALSPMLTFNGVLCSVFTSEVIGKEASCGRTGLLCLSMNFED